MILDSIMKKDEVVKAHMFSSNHKKQLLKDEICGCFYCLKIFPPKEIEEWIDYGRDTALFSYCGIDSVIGESSGYPITIEFLRAMKEYWF